LLICGDIFVVSYGGILHRQEVKNRTKLEDWVIPSDFVKNYGK